LIALQAALSGGIQPALLDRDRLLVLVAVFCAPILAVLTAQGLRGELVARDYDSPSRFLLAALIFAYVASNRFNVKRFYDYCVPAAVLLIFATVLLFPDYRWGTERLATYFTDPLTCGSLTLGLGAMCLAAVRREDGVGLNVLKAICFVLAVYVSIRTGSRTGWLALPLVIFIVYLHHNPSVNAGVLLRSVLLVAAVSFLLFHFSAEFQLRILDALDDVRSYRWSSLNPSVTPVGYRISFYRMGMFLFALKPLAGWGDQGFLQALHTPAITQFASNDAIMAVYQHGFHSELMTNMVRSGIWGLAATLMVFFVPLAYLGRAYFQGRDSYLRQAALIGISLWLCVIISSLSTEVFNLKFTATFYAAMLALSLGAIFR
jgi:O-antigen ligase